MAIADPMRWRPEAAREPVKFPQLARTGDPAEDKRRGRVVRMLFAVELDWSDIVFHDYAPMEFE